MLCDVTNHTIYIVGRIYNPSRYKTAFSTFAYAVPYAWNTLSLYVQLAEVCVQILCPENFQRLLPRVASERLNIEYTHRQWLENIW